MFSICPSLYVFLLPYFLLNKFIFFFCVCSHCMSLKVLNPISIRKFWISFICYLYYVSASWGPPGSVSGQSRRMLLSGVLFLRLSFPVLAARLVLLMLIEVSLWVDLNHNPHFSRLTPSIQAAVLHRKWVRWTSECEFICHHLVEIRLGPQCCCRGLTAVSRSHSLARGCQLCTWGASLTLPGSLFVC